MSGQHGPYARERMIMTLELAATQKSIVDAALAKCGDISTLPEVTAKIIHLVEDPDSTARDMHDVIKTDPALSARVLKVVNSAFYGLPGQIGSVDRAIVLLGLSAVKNIAIAASIARLFKGRRISAEFSASDLWRHSVAVAVGAHSLAKISPNEVMLDEIFVAGMIHDIGTMVERQAYPDEFADVIQSCMSGRGSLLECERQIIGADHQAFGVGLTTKWKFPRHLRAAVGFHHNPESLSVELRNLAVLIQVGDIICCEEKIGFYLSAQGQTVTPEMLDVIHITEEQLEVVRTELPDKLAEAETMLSS